MTEPMPDVRLEAIRNDPWLKRAIWCDGEVHDLIDMAQELLAEVDRCHGILAGSREEYALYRGLAVSADPAEHWTGPGANGAAEGAVWKLRATSGADVTVVRRYATPWSVAATEESADV